MWSLHLNSFCAVVKASEQRISCCVLHVWKATSAESPDSILWTSTGGCVWKWLDTHDSNSHIHLHRRMKRKRLSRPTCGLRLWVFIFLHTHNFVLVAENVEQLFKLSTLLPHSVLCCVSWPFSLMSPTAMDWLSLYVEHLWLLWHWYYPCPVQHSVASWHCPWEQVRRKHGVIILLVCRLWLKSGVNSFCASFSAASMASLTWLTMPMCWSATLGGCTGYLPLSIGALVPLRSPTSRLTIKTARYHSGEVQLYHVNTK